MIVLYTRLENFKKHFVLDHCNITALTENKNIHEICSLIEYDNIDASVMT